MKNHVFVPKINILSGPTPNCRHGFILWQRRLLLLHQVVRLANNKGGLVMRAFFLTFLVMTLFSNIELLGENKWLVASLIECPGKFQYHANFYIEFDNNSRSLCKLRFFDGIPFNMSFKFNDSNRIYTVRHKADEYASDFARASNLQEISPGMYWVFGVDIVGDYIISTGEMVFWPNESKNNYWPATIPFRDFARKKPGILTLSLIKSLCHPMPDYNITFDIPWDGEKFKIAKNHDGTKWSEPR